MFADIVADIVADPIEHETAYLQAIVVYR